MKKLILFPFNGNAIEAVGSISAEWDLIGFVDDTPAKQGARFGAFKVYSRDLLKEEPDAKVLAVPGSPVTYRQRAQLIADLNIPPERFATVVHDRAWISPFAKLGLNTLIMAGVVLTSNCTIGDHVCILPNSVIHHDSSVGDYSLIGSNVTIAGHTSIGSNCYIGSGTSIINGIEVGDGTLIGMGSNVISSLPREVKAVGNPARLL